jgi:hypothetical protein
MSTTLSGALRLLFVAYIVLSCLGLTSGGRGGVFGRDQNRTHLWIGGKWREGYNLYLTASFFFSLQHLVVHENTLFFLRTASSPCFNSFVIYFQTGQEEDTCLRKHVLARKRIYVLLRFSFWTWCIAFLGVNGIWQLSCMIR